MSLIEENESVFSEKQRVIKYLFFIFLIEINRLSQCYIDFFN